jgi:hypothetical protein
VLLNLLRLKKSEEELFQKNVELKAQKETLEEEKLRLKQDHQEIFNRMTELSNQNAKLIGHNNQKQKIQLHIKIKEENNLLRKVELFLFFDLRDLFEIGHSNEGRTPPLSLFFLGEERPARIAVDEGKPVEEG